MKKILKFVSIFIVSLLILFFTLVVSSKIPRSCIEENLQDSIEFYKKNIGIKKLKNKKIYSYIHYYADTVLLNIIYNIDSEKPVSSTLWANFYQTIKIDSNKDFIDLVEQDKVPNTQYLRYWHGSMAILRPLLAVFNIEQIYLLNKIVMSILALVLFIMLFRRSKQIAFIFLIALILVASWYVPLCFEYSWTFDIMLIVSIIAVKKDEKLNAKKRLYSLFFVTGIVTCFLDFLTTEILTIFIPLLLVLAIRKKEGRLESIKNTFKFIIKAAILWLIGYAGMFLAKWCISSLVLGINAFDYVKDNAMLRINGLQGLDNYSQLYGKAIYKNFSTIPLISIISANIYKWEVKLSIATIIILLLISIDWKNVKKKKFSLIMLFIGIMPYLRYLILANHSYRHSFFTFRDQIITMMAILFIIFDNLNYRLIFKKISLTKPLKLVHKENKIDNITNNQTNHYKKNIRKHSYLELTILIPCLNEEKTLGICINKAKKFLSENNVNGEILIADNGSIDNSKNIALELGARVVDVQEKGYGNALINGTKSAKGKYTIMGDADDSYNFLEIMQILEKLREGNDFVIGNRYKGKMEKGAMPFSHKYIGTQIISWIGRKKYKLKIGDFNCGLRGYDTKKIIDLNCKCTGMEYATEMIIKAKQAELKIAEIPINFYKDGRNKKPHLKAIPDGIKHLKVLIKSRVE